MSDSPGGNIDPASQTAQQGRQGGRVCAYELWMFIYQYQVWCVTSLGHVECEENSHNGTIKAG